MIGIFCTLCLTACGTTTSSNTSNKQSSDNSGSSEIQDSSNSTSTSSKQETSYSDLLNFVMTNEEYNELIEYQRGGILESESAAFDPHPYAFFESRGLDIYNVKNGRLKAFTKSYVLNEEPNNLYIFTYCSDATATYYNEYHLKYTLTTEEMNDYKMVHEQGYKQAFFINDAVSRLKTPEILSECKCGIKAHNEINSDLNSLGITKDVLGGRYGTDIFFKEFNEETQKFQVYIFPDVCYSHENDLHEKAKCAIYYLRCSLKPMNVVNDAYMGPSDYPTFKFDSSLFDPDNEQQYVLFDTTWYNSQYAEIWRFDNLNE